MEIPETRYAQSGDVSIAYQIFGAGALDVVVVPGFVSNVELAWEQPEFVTYVQGLASLGRVIMFDKRGTGLSDRVKGIATLEERMDDVRAVMDAAGSERAFLFGVSEGGPMSILFAATYPDRTVGLGLYGCGVKAMRSPGYPWGETAEAVEHGLRRSREAWGTLEHAREVAEWAMPSLAHDDEVVARFATMLRLSASPGAAVDLGKMNAEIDVSHVLSAIRVPTIVLQRTGDGDTAESRWIAERIEGARFVELPGRDHLPWAGDTASLLAALEEFVGGLGAEREPDRVLATVLFTDIVGSTAKAVELGDRGWRQLLEQHHMAIRRELARFRGVELDTAGDGFFARFDGPARAIRCACAIADSLELVGLEVRAGLHTGECEILDEKVAGIAVSIGARVAAQAGAGEVLVSQTVKDLVAGSGITFNDRGVTPLKGVPGEWRLYAVADAAA
ncbi:MAG: adenylate/guanylate cyclase domain-containing protein [Gaiellaceae bacterium]